MLNKERKKKYPLMQKFSLGGASVPPEVNMREVAQRISTARDLFSKPERRDLATSYLTPGRVIGGAISLLRRLGSDIGPLVSEGNGIEFIDAGDHMGVDMSAAISRVENIHPEKKVDLGKLTRRGIPCPGPHIVRGDDLCSGLSSVTQLGRTLWKEGKRENDPTKSSAAVVVLKMVDIATTAAFSTSEEVATKLEPVVKLSHNHSLFVTDAENSLRQRSILPKLGEKSRK